MESVSRVGLVLRAARERRGWTLTELAEHSGITRQSIAKIEEGHPRGEIGIVSQLASTLGFELAVREIPGSEHHMNLIGRLRARADKSSRDSVLARGVYGSQLASQVPDDVLQHRALHLVRHWTHAARYSNSWVLAGALPSQVYRILSAGDPTSPEVLNLCGYPMPYLFVRLAVEHPWWLATRPQTSATLDDRRDLACIVAKYGTQPAPDHRGQLVNHNKRIRTQAAATSHWLSASSNALDALNPALAQEIANALARELWGRWFLQDLQLHAFPHERGDDTTQYFVTDAPNGARGRYRGEPTFAAATHWPEAEAEQLADDGWTRGVRRELFQRVDALADIYGPGWAENMSTLANPLDSLSFNGVAQLLATEVDALSPDREYELALASLTETGDTEDHAIRTAVIAAARRSKLQIVSPEAN